MYDKVIFLDVDGVLNGETKLIYFLYKLNNLSHDKIRKKLLDWDIFGSRWIMVFYLWVIVKFTNAKIVMSSSWRGALTRYTIDELRNTDDTRWSNLIHKLDFFNLSISDITPHLYPLNRGDEIKKWIDNHSSVNKFIILDDESFNIEEILPNHLIKTSYQDRHSH